MKKFFEIIHQSKKSKARTGKITTSHGTVLTPAFVPVATQGTIKALPPQLLKEVPLQIAFVNNYHLVNSPGFEVIEKAGGIHNFSKINFPLMSDSGGFQVFSLAQKKKAYLRDKEQVLVLKITKEGVMFRSLVDGRDIFFSPEKAIQYQIKIGADIIMAFDECLSYPVTREKALRSLERTNLWLLKSIETFKKLKSKSHRQFLFGIVQGGIFKDLRESSAKFVGQREVDGLAIGGVSVGEPKKEMQKAVKWAISYLPREKPLHLLGVGEVDDILNMIPLGIDSFDCVEPTRFAREGKLYRILDFSLKEIIKKKLKTSQLIFDIKKNRFHQDLNRLTKNCFCFSCQNFSRAYLHHLFRQKEVSALFLATLHNLYQMEKLFSLIRQFINKDEI